MGKKFIPVICKNRLHKLFCDDIKKVYYISKKKSPPVPTFEPYVDENYPDFKLKTKLTSCEAE